MKPYKVPLSAVERDIRSALQGADLDPSADNLRLWIDMWRSTRVGVGFNATAPRLMSPPTANSKIGKNDVPTWSMSLSPARLSGRNLCSHSTPQCRLGCLNTAGRGRYATVQRGRLARSRFLLDHPVAFCGLWLVELEILARRHMPYDWGTRGNTLSDIAWEHVCPEIAEYARVAHTYDYTKKHWRLECNPSYWHLAPSISEKHGEQDVIELCEAGHTPIVIMQERPQQICGFDTFDADENDQRWADKPGTVGVLTPKGRMKKNPEQYIGFIKPNNFGQPLAVRSH